MLRDCVPLEDVILDCGFCCVWFLLVQQHIILLVGVMPSFALVEGSRFCIVFLCMDVPQFVHLFCLHGNLAKTAQGEGAGSGAEGQGPWGF